MATDYRRQDYFTPRCRDHQGPLENTLPPMRPIWQDIIAAALLIVFICALVFV